MPMIPSAQKLLSKFLYFFSDYRSVENTSKTSLDKNQDKMTTRTQLRASLKQLEFISYFEMHIAKNHEKSYSLTFLQELERIKYDSQINTINLINHQKL